MVSFSRRAVLTAKLSTSSLLLIIRRARTNRSFHPAHPPEIQLLCSRHQFTPHGQLVEPEINTNLRTEPSILPRFLSVSLDFLQQRGCWPNKVPSVPEIASVFFLWRQRRIAAVVL